MIIIIYLFIIGSVIASFANALIYRIPRQIAIYKGRSYCENCYHKLSWYDLIPIVSYLLLKGKCRYCHHEISINHLLFECFGGCLMIFCFYYFSLSFKMILIFLIVMNLIVIAIIDYNTMDIYLSTILSLLVLVITYRYLIGMNFVESAIAALLISLTMFIFNFFIPDSFGFGDIELMFVSGILLGIKRNILAFCLGVIIAGLYVSYLLIFKKVDVKKHIAFAPFLVVGIVILLFYGNQIIMWYMY